MSKHYRDYIWKSGIPYGINTVDVTDTLSYKIPMDPYRKRIAVEEWKVGKFNGLRPMVAAGFVAASSPVDADAHAL